MFSEHIPSCCSPSTNCNRPHLFEANFWLDVFRSHQTYKQKKRNGQQLFTSWLILFLFNNIILLISVVFQPILLLLSVKDPFFDTCYPLHPYFFKHLGLFECQIWFVLNIVITSHFIAKQNGRVWLLLI